MLEGSKSVDLQGRTLTLSPLNLRELRVMEEIDVRRKSGELAPPAAIEETVKLLHASAARNEPDLTLDQVREAITLPNFPRAVQALMEASS